MWHLLVVHPELKSAPTKWESMRSSDTAAQARSPSFSIATASSTAPWCARRQAVSAGARQRKWRSSPTSSGAPARSKTAGFARVVVTNQPEVARGDLDARRARCRCNLQPDGAELSTSTRFSSAPTTTRTNARAGSRSRALLLDAAERHGVDLADSYMIGDRWRDIDAGHAAGCRATVFIDRELRRSRSDTSQTVLWSRRLEEAAAWIIWTQSALAERRTCKLRRPQGQDLRRRRRSRRRCLSYRQDPLIAGFTTNPTLMRKAGVTDYEAFAHAALEIVGDRPISFEVFTDDFDEMERRRARSPTWGENVYVKIPVTNTKGNSAAELVKRARRTSGVKLNVTAMMTLEQVERDLRGPRRRRAGVRLAVRRPHRRHRRRPGPDDREARRGDRTSATVRS